MEHFKEKNSHVYVTISSATKQLAQEEQERLQNRKLINILWIAAIGVEYGGALGLEPPKKSYSGGLAPGQVLNGKRKQFKK